MVDDLPRAEAATAGAPDIATWIRKVQAGEPGARDGLFAAAYGELRALARARLREGGRSTVLGTTVLVHESYLRFVRAGALRSADRRAFFAYAGQVMRTVIVDTLRERRALRRGGVAEHCTLDTDLADVLPCGEDDVLHVHDALRRLARIEPRLAQVVEWRYFVGLSEAEIAAALDLSDRSVRRLMDKAQALLKAMLD